MEQLKGKARWVGLPGENTGDPKVLRADVRGEVLPARVLGIGGWLDRVWPDVAEPTGHPDAIGLYQVLGIVVIRVFIKALGIPLFCCRFVKIRIGKKPQANDTRCVTVIGADRQALAACPDGDARLIFCIFERVRRAIGTPLVKPQTEALWVGAGGLIAAGFVYPTEVIPAIVAAELQTGVGRQRFQKIEIPNARF